MITWCFHDKVRFFSVYRFNIGFQQEKYGKPYQARHSFTCKAQVDGFKELLANMASRPQDYVTPSGRMTTNAVEGFHGLALMYRGKQTDLEHTHYTCKTDMAVCHKVNVYTNTIIYHSKMLLSEYWPCVEGSVLHENGNTSTKTCCTKFLKEQDKWEKSRERRSTKQYIHTR